MEAKGGVGDTAEEQRDLPSPVSGGEREAPPRNNQDF